MPSSARLARAELAYRAPSGATLVDVFVDVTLVQEDGALLPEPRYEVTLVPAEAAFNPSVDYLISRLSSSVDRWGWEEDEEWGEGAQYATLSRGDDLWKLYCSQELGLCSVEVYSDLVGRWQGFYDGATPNQAWKAWFQATHLSGVTRECIPQRLLRAAHRSMSRCAAGGAVDRADSWALKVAAA